MKLIVTEFDVCRSKSEPPVKRSSLSFTVQSCVFGLRCGGSDSGQRRCLHFMFNEVLMRVAFADSNPQTPASHNIVIAWRSWLTNNKTPFQSYLA